jgi:ABC-type multidrug transport system ATPase subunit
MSSLIIENIQFSYSKNKLLSDIYIHCSIGEVIGLLGRNGSGKSTLFKIITGLLHDSSMILRIDNKPARVETIYKYISYLPQESFLPQEFKIDKCIGLFIEDASKSNFVLNDERVKRLNNCKIGKLSGGERRYFELLLILFSKQEYAILDEPFSELDPINKQKAIEHIKCIGNNKGIILTDQDYRSVFAASRSRLLLTNGHLKNINTEVQLIQNEYLPRK